MTTNSMKVPPQALLALKAVLNATDKELLKVAEQEWPPEYRQAIEQARVLRYVVRVIEGQRRRLTTEPATTATTAPADGSSDTDDGEGCAGDGGELDIRTLTPGAGDARQHQQRQLHQRQLRSAATRLQSLLQQSWEAPASTAEGHRGGNDDDGVVAGVKGVAEHPVSVANNILPQDISFYAVVFQSQSLGLKLEGGKHRADLPFVTAPPTDKADVISKGDLVSSVNGVELKGEKDAFTKMVELVKTAGRPVSIGFLTQESSSTVVAADASSHTAAFQSHSLGFNSEAVSEVCNQGVNKQFYARGFMSRRRKSSAHLCVFKVVLLIWILRTRRETSVLHICF